MAELYDERGEAAAITAMIANNLIKIGHDSSGWRTLYQHRESQEFWELSYPHSERHGGGPRLLQSIGGTRPSWATGND